MTHTAVLYEEDEEDDAFLMQMGFERAGVKVPLKVVPDGRQAVEYLSGTGIYADRQQYPLPCLVLLDLNLPVMNGFEVLKWVRQHSAFRDLPVVIFSSSSHPRDRQRAQELGANDYLVKPVNMGELTELIHGLQQKWLPQEGASVRG